MNLPRYDFSIFSRTFSYVFQQFSDFGLHSTSVHLKKQPVKGNPGMFEVVRYVLLCIIFHCSYLRHVGVKPEKMLVSDVFGYNSLYPLMFRLIPVDSPHLKIILTKLRDRKVHYLYCLRIYCFRFFGPILD